MSYSEDTTDLEGRGIMGESKSVPPKMTTDMTLAKANLVPILEVGT